MRNRREDARFDAAIHDRILRDTGVIEEDQPTEYSHYAWTQAWRKRAYGEFTPEERYRIRLALGLVGDDNGER